MSRFLASVDNLDDAIIAAGHGVDVIDLKDPGQGALGGLDIDTIHSIVDHLWEKSVISATVGDLEADVALILDRIGKVADTGVDFVKVGMFSQRHIEECLPAFAYHARRGINIIAVLFADRQFDMTATIKACKRARLSGVMLDTAGKNAGSLLLHKKVTELNGFVHTAKQHGLLTGLAGSLREQDIQTLLPINPDYIGFRTALCKNRNRTGPLCEIATRNIRNRIPDSLVQVQSA